MSTRLENAAAECERMSRSSGMLRQGYPNRLNDAAKILRYIELLRAEEGDSVTICCDKADFDPELPNSIIFCSGDWTGWNEQRFGGDDLLLALQAACDARQALTKQPTEKET